MLNTFVETRMVPVDLLEHFPGNANIGDVGKIRESLRANGQYRALIVRATADKRLIILAGNHTFDALVEEGAREVRCEIHVLDDKTALKINLADNRYPEYSERDTDKLLELIDTLDGDLDGSGYDDEDVHLMLTPPEVPMGPQDPDALVIVIEFDNKVQRQTWDAFVKFLEREYPDFETLGERLTADIGCRGLDH